MQAILKFYKRLKLINLYALTVELFEKFVYH